MWWCCRTVVVVPDLLYLCRRRRREELHRFLMVETLRLRGGGMEIGWKRWGQDGAQGRYGQVVTYHGSFLDRDNFSVNLGFCGMIVVGVRWSRRAGEMVWGRADSSLVEGAEVWGQRGAQFVGGLV